MNRRGVQPPTRPPTPDPRHPTIAGLVLLASSLYAAMAVAQVPATPLMTLYRFDGPSTVPYYELERFLRTGPTSPAGTLAQGSSVIPCLVIRDGRPVTDEQGTPYVGFEVVVDAETATPAESARFTEAFN